MMRFILFLLAAILIALSLFSCTRTTTTLERTVPDFTDAGVSNLITKSRYQLLVVENCVMETVSPMRDYINGSVSAYRAPNDETGWTEDGIRTRDVEWNHMAGQAETWAATSDEVKSTFLKALREFYDEVPPSSDPNAGEIQIRGLTLTSPTGYTTVRTSVSHLMTMEGTPYTIYSVELAID
jgi:hypothetical protein